MRSGRPARDLVAALEASPVLRGAGQERFSGYAVLGVRFAAGDVLALRRFTASSVGLAYTSVWHRDPAGTWVMHQTVAPDGGCGRYFSDGVARISVSDIRITWPAANRFVVTIERDPSLEWELFLGTTLLTRLISRLAAAGAGAIGRSPAAARLAGGLAGHVLGTGPLSLAGETPNGFRFLSSPDEVRFITASRAAIGTRNTGPATASSPVIRLGDVSIPRRGLFALENAAMEPVHTRVAGFPPAWRLEE